MKIKKKQEKADVREAEGKRKKGRSKHDIGTENKKREEQTGEKKEKIEQKKKRKERECARKKRGRDKKH